MTEQADVAAGEVPTPATVAAQIAPRQLNQKQIDSEVASALREAEAILKPGDYDEVKAAAEGAGTLEQQIVRLEQEIASTRLASLRVAIAAKFGISDEDREVLMTGADEGTLVMQAERLARSAMSLGNVAPREGNTVNTVTDTADRDMRSFVGELMGSSDPLWD